MATHAAAHGGKTGREPGSDAEQRGLPWPGAVTPRSTTRPLDYALLEGAFLTCFIGVVALARRREGRDALAIASSELPVMAMAVFALADVLAKEKVSTWIREPFVVESSTIDPVCRREAVCATRSARCSRAPDVLAHGAR
jgi:hypothetical protein